MINQLGSYHYSRNPKKSHKLALASYDFKYSFIEFTAGGTGIAFRLLKTFVMFILDFLV